MLRDLMYCGDNRTISTIEILIQVKLFEYEEALLSIQVLFLTKIYTSQCVEITAEL